jgi:2-methylisocitrate lyase-like PEP mutase family enzyme
MIMGMRDEDTFRWFRQRIKDVPMLAMGGFGPLGVNEYKSIGYQVVIYPQLSIQTSLRAVHDLWKSVKATGILPPPGDAWTLTGELLEMDKKYAIEAATTEAKSAVGATA